MRALKVLLDESLPHTLRHRLAHRDTMTAASAGFAGHKNGALLDAAEAGGFDVLVTGDGTLHHEQNMKRRKIALVSLSAISWPAIEPHIERIIAAVDAAVQGSFTRVDCGAFVRPGSRRKPGEPERD